MYNRQIFTSSSVDNHNYNLGWQQKIVSKVLQVTNHGLKLLPLLYKGLLYNIPRSQIKLGKNCI